jgi:hypothetical protein
MPHTSLLQELLKPRFKRNWHCSLAIVQSLLNRLGAAYSSPILDGAVVALVALHHRYSRSSLLC